MVYVPSMTARKTPSMEGRPFNAQEGRQARERLTELVTRFVRDYVKLGEPLDTYGDAELVRSFNEWASDAGLTAGMQPADEQDDEPYRDD